MEPGERLTLASGPFKGFEAELLEVDPARGLVRAKVTVFGRAVPVEVPLADVRSPAVDPALLLPHLEALHAASPAERRAGARGLAGLGVAAASPEVVAALGRRLDGDDDAEVRRESAAGLQALGADAASGEAPALLRAAREDRAARVREAALRALRVVHLAALEPRAAEVLAAFGDPDEGARGAALLVFARRRDEPLGAGLAARLLPALRAALEGDPSPAVRSRAAFGLGCLGPAAAPAVDALLAHARAQAGTPAHDGVAEYALGRLGPAALGALTELVRHADPKVRLLAARALGDLGEAGGPAAADVARALDAAADADGRAEIAFALGELGPAAAPAVPALVRALADERREVRSMAASALGRIGPAAAAAAVEPLAEVAARRAARGACVALWQLGPAAGPALVRLLGGEDGEVRDDAAHALGLLGVAWAPGAEPALARALADPRPRVREGAADALGRDGSAAAVPALLRALGAEQDERARGALERALGRLRSGG